MRSIDGHFTIINEPGTARALAENLLNMFESVRSPEHIIITQTLLKQAASRAQGILSASLAHKIAQVEAEIAALALPDEKVTHIKIEKAQVVALDATTRAEKSSSSKNWRKLDKARKALAKQLERAGFASYTAYADFINAQGVGGARRLELLIRRDELIAEKKVAETQEKSLVSLTPSQIITVLADVLSRAPHTAMGPLPIVIDDALRHLEVSTKLRALEVLKAHATQYATWYVTDDPLILSWGGFKQDSLVSEREHESAIYDMDVDIAS
ncbi:MAG TPA: hypothetical protein PKB15_04750 [Acidimicrobiia bacterium]|nr:hypothetical protein [Acidimicrobiia bacterium]